MLLLESRPWHQIPIADIAREAGMSVGGFYARFKSKEALLLVLHRIYEQRRVEYFGRFLESPVRERPLAERVVAVVGAGADWMHQNRAILRTFLVRYWSRPDQFHESFDDRLADIYGRMATVLAGDHGEIRRPDPDAASRLVLTVVAASCRDRILKPAPGPGAVDVPLAEFKAEMTELVLCYLIAPTSP